MRGKNDVFVAEIINNFAGKSIAFAYCIIFSKYSLCFGMRSLKSRSKEID